MLTAHYENREYFFTLKNKSSKEITITMYNMIYVFVKSETGWVNHDANRLKATMGLINAIIEAVD